MNNQSVQVQGLNKFYSKIYAFLAMGVGISALISYLSLTVFRPQVAGFINGFPLGFMGLWIVEIALVFVLGMKAQKNPSLAIGGFIAYSVINGLTLAVTLEMYTPGKITAAFITSAGMFLGMSAVGMFTKKDLSGIGRAGYSALIGIILAILLNSLMLHSQPVDYFISILMVIIFAGITAYDNQNIRTIYNQTNGQANNGVAVFMALQLYLDFINLFLAFLRIFGRD
ncbi:hypothetical protein IGI37_001494 [Enterococcus sp. AZ194]|uniref:Bax inhibitor-1/YccA family protein n=1 Tax=Enterococcus sp. AZ194 TaxID=2774629 RepID=UPI003F24434A